MEEKSHEEYKESYGIGDISLITYYENVSFL